jgi:outer membrane receptor protein involved in Fe transport
MSKIPVSMRGSLLAAMLITTTATVMAQPAPGSAVDPIPTDPAPAVPSAEPAPMVAPALKHSLHGLVIDDKTKNAIPGAFISVTSGATALAESDGTFSLSVTDTDSLRVEADGYEPGEVTTALEGTADYPLKISLSAIRLVKGEVVQVKGKAPAKVSGGVTLSRNVLATIPGTGGDLLASLTMVPGVSIPQGRGGGQGIVIRGSAPQDSRFLLDGFEIPQLYHLFNRSVIPTQAVANLEFQPGGFDVKYGHASSGIISVTSRGGGEEYQAVAEVSIIDAYAVASGPINKKLRMLASFRRSYVDTWLPSVLPTSVGLVAAPRFFDGLVRLDYDASSRWHAALTLIGSDDLTKLIAAQEQTDKGFAFSADTSFARAIAAAYWRGPKQLTVDLAASALVQKISFSAGDQFLDIRRIGMVGRAELTKRYDTWAGLREVAFRTGLELDPKRNKLALELIQSDARPQGGFMDDISPRNKFSGKFWLPDAGAWATMEAGLSSTIRFTSGFRLDGFYRNRDYTLAPRGDLVWKPDDKTKVRFAAGRYTRPPEYRDELLSDKLKAESAIQMALGVEHKFADGGNIQLTAYDTERSSLVFRDATTGQYGNQGRGRTIGAEVLATYQNQQWFAWLAYSLSRSTRRSTAQGKDFLFEYDQTHDVVAAATYKTKNGHWQFGARFNFSTGKPSTPIIGAIFNTDRDRYFPISGELNSERYGAAHQLDVRVDHIWKFKTWALSAFLDVNNAYLHPAVIQYQYNFDYTQREEIKNIPILPSIGLKGEL